MLSMEDLVTPGGILLLAVPVAADAVLWNCHRSYGPLRLTELLRRWQVVAVYGMDEDIFSRVKMYPSQPLFVLRNRRPERPVDFSSPDWRDVVAANGLAAADAYRA
mmetsp:Transcript_25310/g.67139  ORF Transcript_25310/g.67139 Transcript_25310/m.67139 type:complete len:106 (+) Transcript_25310:1112-1429(+)